MQQLVGRSRNVFEEVKLRGIDDYFVPIECEHPCPHEPGSVEKIKTLRDRLERGEELFHPLDYKQHATHEQSNATRNFVARALVDCENAPLHVRHRRERMNEIEAIKSSPEYVTALQLKNELGVSFSAVERWLRNQNPRFRLIKGNKYYLRSSLKAID